MKISTKKHLIFTILLGFVCSLLIAQTQKSNSSKSNSDKVKLVSDSIQLLIQLSEEKLNSEPDKSFIFSGKALALAQQLNDPAQLVYAFFSKSLAFRYLGERDSAESNSNITLDLVKKYNLLNTFSNKIDELINTIDVSRDTVKVKHVLNFIFEVSQFNTAASISYSNLCHKACQKIEYKKGQFYAVLYKAGSLVKSSNLEDAETSYKEALNLMSTCHNCDPYGRVKSRIKFDLSAVNLRRNNFDKALILTNEIYEEALLQKDTMKTIRVLLRLGYIYGTSADYTNCIRSYLSAVRFSQIYKPDNNEGNKVRQYYKAHGGLANVYLQMKDIKKAIHHYEIAIQNPIEYDRYNALSNLGRAYVYQGKFEKALQTHHQNLQIQNNSESSCRTGTILLYIGETFNHIGNYDSALWYLNKGFNRTNGCQENFSLEYLQLGIAYFNKDDIDQAIENFNKVLELSKAFLRLADLEEAYQWLYKCYKVKNDYAQSLNYHESFLELKDSLFNEEKVMEISKREAEFEFEQEKKEIEFQNQKNQILLEQKEKLANLRLVLATITLVLILSISIYIFRRRIKQKELANKELEQANKLQNAMHEKDKELLTIKQKFFDNISHEIRTPVTLILGAISRVGEEINFDKSISEHVDTLKKNGSHLLNLVNELLDFRKLEGNQLKLKISPVEIYDFTHEIFLSFKSLASKKNIKFQIHKEQKNNKQVWIDTVQMEKVIYNLLYNAFKFVDENQSVEVKVNHDDQHCFITIEDTGKGIPAKQVKNIFQRFYQSENHQFSHDQGFGIGLSIVHEIVRLHQGEISVESQEGKGTKFIVKLLFGNYHFPENQIIDNDVQESIKKTEPTLLADDESEDLKTTEELTILIVEDNVELRTYIKQILSSRYTILEASNGKEGFDIAKEETPDLIISDVMMPLKNGVELVQDIKSDMRTSHIPTILLTARSGIIYKKEGFDVGADDYITKPFNEILLLSRIQNLIATRKKIWQKIQVSKMTEPVKLSMNTVDEEFLNNLIHLIEINLSENDINAEFLTQEMGMSHSVIYRKLKQLTGQSIVEFVRDFKLKRAAELMGKFKYSVKEACFKSGFSDKRYFSTVFKKRFGKSPKQYALSQSAQSA